MSSTFLLILFLCFFAYLVWQNLIWAIAFIVAFLPSYLIRFSIGPVPMTLLESMVLILFTVWFIKLKIKNEKLKNTIKNLKLENWLWLILAWLAVATVAMFISPSLRAAAGVWKAYFIEPILFLVVFLNVVKEKKDLELLFYALGFSALHVSAFAIYQKFTGIAIPNPIWQAAETRRVTSFYGYPNAVGLYLAPNVTLYIGWLINKLQITNYKLQKKELIVNCYLLIVIASSVLAIIFARSEGAYAGILVGLIFFGLMIKKLRLWTIAGTAALILIILFVPHFKNYVWQQITFQNDSGKVRLTQWQETWDMLKDRPIFGAGLAGYQETFVPYHKAKHIEIYLYPHNLFLNFWSELGLAGLLVFIAIISKFLKDTLFQFLVTRYWLLITASSAMITLLVHGLVDVPYFKNDLSILFWLIIASSIATQKRTLDKSSFL